MNTNVIIIFVINGFKVVKFITSSEVTKLFELL